MLEPSTRVARAGLLFTATLVVVGCASSPPAAIRAAPGDPLIDGAWRSYEPGPGQLGLPVPAPDSVEAALAVGRWAARVPPVDAEVMPRVQVFLDGAVALGAKIGVALYTFEAYACEYDLLVARLTDETVELRQRQRAGRCAEAGRIYLHWEEGAVIGDWRRADSTRWFMARLAPDAVDRP